MNPAKQYAICVIAGLLVAWLILLFCGCQSAPDPKAYITDDCYAFADCMYRIRKGEDKAACATLAEACRDSLKEKRVYQRIKYCHENCPSGMSESECRLLLNQK